MGQLRQTEVKNLHAPVASDENVFRLQIAVDDSLVMCRSETARDLLGSFNRLAQRHSAQPVAQSLPFKKLRHQVRRALMLAKIVNGEDVGMIQRGDGLRLLLEAPQSLGIAGESSRQNLNRNVTVEPRVARPIHLAHAARSDCRYDFVRPEFCPRSKSHPCAQL